MQDTLLILAVALAAFAAVCSALATVRIARQDARARELEERLRAQLRELDERQEARARADRREQGDALRELAQSSAAAAAETNRLFQQQGDTLSRRVNDMAQRNEDRLERLRGQVEQGLEKVRQDNAVQLESMRKTVDEKLSTTLEQRLGESFKLVSQHLDQVSRGLGEMQALASGVGDLKRVLQNVKSRGTWGEVQLGALLEQVLAPNQYAANVATRPGSAERVEFAIRLPGQEGEAPVWLPVDAKFPQEDYLRLMDAQDAADPVAAEAAGKALEARLLQEGRTISEKYVAPPHTTDFAIMFLPSEGLYAEALRRADLADNLQRRFRIVMAGPTTLAALLNSLQMGFRTLAVQQRSSEVWTLLGAVKTDFGKFSDILAKTVKKIQEAGNTLESAERKTRTIQRKLRSVEELEPERSAPLLWEGDEEAGDAP